MTGLVRAKEAILRIAEQYDTPKALWSKVGSNKADAGNTSRNSVMSVSGHKRKNSC
jgi:hypothetical protein